MPDDPTRHPEENTLVDFGLGRLDPQQAREIADHLEECEPCAETACNVHDNTFLTTVRRADSLLENDETDGRETEDTATHVIDQAALDHGGQKPIIADSSAVDATAVVDGDFPAELQNHPRYRVLKLIGRGGMGNVYRAEHRMMNREVAIKVVAEQFVSNSQAVRRFQREVRAAARLQHPNIVASYDAEEISGVHFLVMELLEGQDAGALLNKHHILPVGIAAEIVRQAATGIEYAHNCSLVHRDIKPSNMMVLQSENASDSAPLQVKVLDLGLARLSAEQDGQDPAATGFGVVLGTIDYMAPEQGWDTHSADHRADVYSLAASLYRMITGRPPYQIPSVQGARERLLRLSAGELTSVRELCPSCPAKLAELIEGALDRDPTERPQSAAELAAALAPFADASNADSLFNGTLLNPQTAATRGSGNRRPGIRRILGGTFFLLILIVAGVLYQVKTNRGYILIEANDPAVAAVLGHSELVVVDRKNDRRWTIDLKGNPDPLPPGTYQLQGPQSLQIRDDSGAFFQASEFELKRGETRRFRISLVPETSPPTEKPEDTPVATVDSNPPVMGLSGGLRMDKDRARLESPLKFSAGQQLTLEAFVRKSELRSRFQNLFSNFEEVDREFRGFHVGVDDKSDLWMISVWDEGISRQVNSNVSCLSDEEVHVAVVIDFGQNLRLFVNGSQVVYLPVSGNIGVTESYIWVGNGVPRSARYSIAADVRQVRISSGKRYTENFQPPADLTGDDDTLALYLLDAQQSGDLVPDASGRGNNARIRDVSWIPASGTNVP